MKIEFIWPILFSSAEMQGWYIQSGVSRQL